MTTEDNNEDFQSAFTDSLNETPDPPVDNSVAPDVGEQEAPEQTSEAGTEQEAQPSPFDNLLSQAKEYGISTDGLESEADLAARALEQLKEQQPYAGYGKQLAPHADEIRRYFEEKQPNQEAQQEESWDEAKYFQEKYGGPQWKAEYDQAVQNGLVERGEDGYWKPVEGRAGGDDIAKGMNESLQFRANFWNELGQKNPYEVFNGVLKEPFMRAVDEKIQQALQQTQQTQQQESAIEKFERENSDWLYTTDPQTGQQISTDQGQKFIDTVHQLRQDGISDNSRLLEIASRIHGLGDQKPEAPEEKQEATPKEDEKRKSFLDSAKERAMHNPSARQPGGDSAPQVMNAGDLEDMFVQAFKGASA